MGCKFNKNELTSTNDFTGIPDFLFKFKFNFNIEKTLTPSNFKFLKIFGRGGFGRVWKIEKKSTKHIYAMKIMSKVKVYDKNSVPNVMNELYLLTKIDHP
jgi:serine/threonine protein kinase